MKHFTVRAMLVMFGLMGAPSAYADNCGTKDRVPLPSCVGTGSMTGGLTLRNGCSFPVVLKIDKPRTSDERVTLSPGKRVYVKAPGKSKVSCCAKMGRCK